MSGGFVQSYSGGSTEDQCAESPNQPKCVALWMFLLGHFLLLDEGPERFKALVCQKPTESRSGPESLGLSRCAACYNQRASFMPRQRGDGESSSSAEDSEPEVDWESEAESSSSSSLSGKALSEMLEKPSPVSGDAAESESAGKDGDGREEVGETLEWQEDKSRTKGMTGRAPCVKSSSLPTSLTPCLTPLSLLPRPHTVVSTLHLQVLPQKPDDDAFYIVKRHLSEKEEEKTEERDGGEREGVNSRLPPQPLQTGSPWQQHRLSYQYQQQPHQLSHQHQQQQPQLVPPLAAQGQRLPPPPHTLVSHPPTLHTPLQALQTHLYALNPQPCWYCYSMYFPFSQYWSHYSSGQSPR